MINIGTCRIQYQMTEQNICGEIPFNRKPDEFQILIVDDNKANLKLLGDMLQAHGYKIRPATSGHLALLSVRAQKPDLILLDILMPEMDGYLICTQLKADEGTRDIPVIFISALEEVTDKVRGFEVGAVDYITKPFEQAEVLVRVRTHLALSLLRKSLEMQNIRLEEEISERERAEEDLRAYQTHLESIIADRTADLEKLIEKLSFQNVHLTTQQETSLDGILVFDEYDTIISYNQRFIHLWDIPEGNLQAGTSDSVLRFLAQQLIESDHLIDIITLLHDRSEEKSRSEFTLKDGRILYLYSAPMISPEGRYYGRVCNFRDITEQKIAHDSLTRATKKLNFLNSVIFNDIQNELFSLSGYLELEKVDKSKEKIPDYLDKQIHIVRAIAESLKFANYYQNLGLIAPAWHNVNQTFLFAISHLDTSPLSRQLQVEGLEIYADPLLENVFFTLAENVIQHGKTATNIVLSYRESSGELILIFEDNGIGIPDEMKEKVFYREYEKKKGIGLFLSREILSITRISITETGESGKGARFELSVPKGMYRFTGSS